MFESFQNKSSWVKSNMSLNVKQKLKAALMEKYLSKAVVTCTVLLCCVVVLW